jgi:hypothetical protein
LDSRGETCANNSSAGTIYSQIAKNSIAKFIKKKREKKSNKQSIYTAGSD